MQDYSSIVWFWGMDLMAQSTLKSKNSDITLMFDSTWKLVSALSIQSLCTGTIEPQFRQWQIWTYKQKFHHLFWFVSVVLHRNWLLSGISGQLTFAVVFADNSIFLKQTLLTCLISKSFEIFYNVCLLTRLHQLLLFLLLFGLLMWYYV